MKFSEAATQGVLSKKVSLKFCKIYKKTLAPESLFLIKIPLISSFLQNTSGRLLLSFAMNLLLFLFFKARDSAMELELNKP